jgi:ATP-dependent helicase/DNAse subunit B
MRPQIEVLAGIAGSGKTTELLALYRDALRKGLARGRPGRTLWLAPTNRARSRLFDRLLDESLPVVFHPNLMTFDGFADQVLSAAPRAATSLTPAMQRILLRRIVAQLSREKRLSHFEKIAGTAGFYELITVFIAELKRSQTWPERFIEVCANRGAKPRDRELGLIYSRYQEALQAGKVYDGEGRFWSAREALEAGHWGRFAELSLVVADGFTDFTEAQYKILELLARKAGRTLIGLLDEAPIVRVDLFAKTRGVIERLREAADVVVNRISNGREGNCGRLPPAINHLSRHLFGNPRELIAAQTAEGLEVVAVAGQGGEINLLASRIKGLLLNGVAPGDIVVAVRDLDGYAGLIEEVFSATGVPYACEAGTPLSRTAPFKALANVLALELEDWPFRRLKTLLDCGLFQPQWEEFAGRQAARDVAFELRRGELDRGRDRILAALGRSTRARADDQSSTTANSSGESHPAVRESASRALRLLQRLSDATAELRRPHDLDGWSGTIATLTREFGFDRALLDNDGEVPVREFGATLAAILFDAARAESVAAIDPSKLTLAEFGGELTDLLERQRLLPRGREEGRVRVLTAEQVRNLDIPWLFFAGLNERSFPQPRGDDCLYGEGERQELNRHGLALGHRAQHAQEELLMFYGIVTRARKQLVLTYPIVSADGQPLSPSPYVTGLIELFDRSALKTGLEEQLDPVPQRDRVLSSADARVVGMSEALSGRPGLFRALCNDRGDATAAVLNCAAAVDMNVHRFHTQGFSNYEGRLQNPRNIELLRQRFSSEHQFSATQLEAYACCPFRFLISNVLAIEPPTEPDIATDYGRRGTLVHEILAQLHKTLFEERETAGRMPGSSRGEEVAAMFQKLLEEKCRERAPLSKVHAALERIEQRLLAEWGMAYGRQWDNYVAGLARETDIPFLPARFETAFGLATRGSGPPANAAPAPGETKPLDFGEGAESVRVGGRIDRIDIGRVEGDTVFTVIDYKSGRRAALKLDTLESGRTLQLVLYALAATRLELAGKGARPWQLGYWHIRESGFSSAVSKMKAEGPLPPLDEAVWDSLVQTLEAIIPRLAAGIRAGQFPVHNGDPHCTAGCPYNTVCRVAQIRALPEGLGKSWAP